jgi:CheY-like chemotaxis protein
MSSRDVELLIVEDNPADAELMLEALREEELTAGIEVVRDGAEALDFILCRGPFERRAPGAPPRVVLLDLKLPKVSGLEVLQQMRSNPHTRRIPVVMFTSSNVERDVVDAYRSGVNSYVQKPVDFARFRETVRRLGRYWLGYNEPPPRRTFAEDAP